MIAINTMDWVRRQANPVARFVAQVESFVEKTPVAILLRLFATYPACHGLEKNGARWIRFENRQTGSGSTVVYADTRGLCCGRPVACAACR